MKKYIDKINNSSLIAPPIFQGEMESPAPLNLVIGERHNINGEHTNDPEWASLKEKELYQGLAILGTPGQGKTNGSIDFILEQLITHPERMGGFLCDPKSTFYRMALKHAKTVNRERDIIGIGTEHKNSFNPFYIPGKSPEQLIDTLMKSVGCLSGGYTLHEQFWIQAAYEVLVNLLNLCDILDIYPTADILYGLATNEKELEKKMSLMVRLLDPKKNPVGKAMTLEQKINEKMKLMQQLNDSGKRTKKANTIMSWFAKWIKMDSRVSTSIGAEVTRWLLPFTTSSPELKKICCPKKEDVTIDSFASILNQGKIIVYDISEIEYGPIARLYANIIKNHINNTILERISSGNKRKMKGLFYFHSKNHPNFYDNIIENIDEADYQELADKYPRINKEINSYIANNDSGDYLNITTPVFTVFDEFQNYVSLVYNSSGDESVYDRLREARAICVIATQSLSALAAKTTNIYALKAVINNFQTIITYRLQDKLTKSFLSENGLSEDLYEMIPELKPFQFILLNQEYSQGYVHYSPRSFEPNNKSWFDYIKEQERQEVDIQELWIEHQINCKGQIKKFENKVKEKKKQDKRPNTGIDSIENSGRSQVIRRLNI